MTGDGGSGPGGPIAGPRPFVGRTRECEALDRARDRAVAGHRTVLRIEGDAGLGKSALLRELIDHLGPDWTVVRATGAEVEVDLDLGVLEQLVLAADRAAAELPVRRPGAGSGNGDDPAPSWRRDRSRPDALDAGSVLLDRLERLLAAGPVAVVVDDAHWCDVLSLDALAFALRRLGGRPVLVVVAHRPVAGGLEAVDRLRRDEGGELVRLEPLTPVELAQLVTSTFGVPLSTRAVARLHEHTRGSPLDALAVVAELGGAEVAAGLGPLPAPRSFGLLVLSRLAASPPDVEAVVAATAVYGHALTLDQLGRMLAPPGGGDAGEAGGGPGRPGPARSAGDLADLVQAAVDDGLLALSDQRGRPHVDVAHPLVRSAVVDDLAPGRRAALHRRAAAVTSDPVRSMLHQLHGTLGDDEELGARAEALAERRIAAGWELEGVGLLAAAAPLVPDPDRRAELLLRGASRLAALGDRDAARRLLDRVPAGSGTTRRSLVEGQLALLAGDGATARAHLEAAWTAGPPDDVAGLVAGLLATLDANQARYESALEWAGRALERGDGGHDIGHPLVMLVSGAALDGDVAAGRAALDRWRPRATGPAAAADAALAGALLDLWGGRADRSIDALLPLLDAGPMVPLLTRATARYTLADAWYRTGDWDRAEAAAEELAAVLAAADHHLVRPMAHSVAAFVHAGRGDLDRARRHLDAGRAAVERSGNPNALLWLWVADGRRAVAAGDPADVVATLDPLARLLGAFHLPDEVQPWRADLVEARVALGDLDEADVLVAEMDAAAPDGGAPARLGAARAAGLVAAARGDHAGASARFAAGLADPERLRAGPFVLARLQVAAGAHALRTGDPAGRGQARDGIAVLDGLGATPFADRARAELDDAAAGPTRPASGPSVGGAPAAPRVAPGAPPLTPAEVAVVELVASGRTNREAAAELYVSIKTVESHLGRAFAKAGVRSRTELALWWQGQGGPRPRSG